MRKLLTSLCALCASITVMAANNGALDGKFTINADGDQIVFSQGNLQYNTNIRIWSFATNQYDTIGANNSTTGIMEFFGWGTGDNPTLTITDNAKYGTYYEWGANPITNGGYKANTWRTLTKDEWDYILNTRDNASSLSGLAKVNGLYGYILLPDDWTLPEGLSFKGKVTYWSKASTYTLPQWLQMEANGAVFLPAAGWRFGTEIYNVGDVCHYWAATPANSGYGYSIDVNDNGAVIHDNSAYYRGYSVRLVQDCEKPNKPINSISLTTVFPKEGDELPGYPLSPSDPLYNVVGSAAVPDGAGYEILAYAFFTPDGNWPEETTFSENTTYVMQVQVAAKEGYSFIADVSTYTEDLSPMTITINGGAPSHLTAGQGQIAVNTTFTTGTATSVKNVQSDDVQCTKVIRDGKMLILRNDKTYTVDGQIVR